LSVAVLALEMTELPCDGESWKSVSVGRLIERCFVMYHAGYVEMDVIPEMLSREAICSLKKFVETASLLLEALLQQFTFAISRGGVL